MADENTQEPVAQIEEADEFAQVFAHLAEGGDPATGVGTGKPAAKLEGEGSESVEGVDGDPAAAPASAPAPAAPAQAPAQAPAAPAQAPAPAEAPAPAPAPAQAPAAPAPAPAAASPAVPEFKLYTPDEETSLADLAKEWPDIDKLIELKARRHSFDLMTQIFAEVNRVMTPVTQYVDHAVTDGHTSALYDAVPDYAAVYQPFVDWVGSQTGVKARMLAEICKEGTADEVAEAINDFKAATNWQAPAAAAPAAAAASPAAAAASAPAAARTLSDAARKAAAVLAPVNGKRSAMPTGGDPNDFDAAWEEANSAEAKA